MTMNGVPAFDPRSDPSYPDPAGSLEAAFRVFSDAAWRFANLPDAADRLRASLRSWSSVPFLLLSMQPSSKLALELFPELVVNVCQGNIEGINMAASVILTLPKTEVERRVVDGLEDLMEAMPDRISADELTHLSDLMVEMGLLAAVRRIAEFARSQSDEEMQRLSKELDGVENDKSKWRLSPAERVARKQAQE